MDHHGSLLLVGIVVVVVGAAAARCRRSGASESTRLDRGSRSLIIQWLSCFFDAAGARQPRKNASRSRAASIKLSSIKHRASRCGRAARTRRRRWDTEMGTEMGTETDLGSGAAKVSARASAHPTHSPRGRLLEGVEQKQQQDNSGQGQGVFNSYSLRTKHAFESVEGEPGRAGATIVARRGHSDTRGQQWPLQRARSLIGGVGTTTQQLLLAGRDRRPTEA